MIYFRFYYSREWGEEYQLDHPIVEIPKDRTTIQAISEVMEHLKIVLNPDILNKIELRFMKK